MRGPGRRMRGLVAGWWHHVTDITECDCPVETRVVVGAFPDVALMHVVRHVSDCESHDGAGARGL